MPNSDELFRAQKTVEADLITWLSVHGNLCLALRHPQNRGPSRRFVAAFVRQLGELLVEEGVLTRDQMENAYALEGEEGGIDENE